MKIIISRKCFDSASGGVPSPILPDGTLLPLPIPSEGDPVSYDQVKINGHKLGPIVEDLTGGRIGAATRCHLDPDLDRGSLRRPVNWRPAFGQIGAAMSHLTANAVEPKDVFLFFGWFRKVERVNRKWRYKSDAPGIHVIYGWMQIAEILSVNSASTSKLEPFSMHPHLHGRPHPSNTLYLSADSFVLSGRHLTGAGLFGGLDERRVLTAPGQANRSVWRLPSWFHWKNGTSVTYHQEESRWQSVQDFCSLRTVGRGQEFVVRPGDPCEAEKWMVGLFD